MDSVIPYLGLAFIAAVAIGMIVRLVRVVRRKASLRSALSPLSSAIEVEQQFVTGRPGATLAMDDAAHEQDLSRAATIHSAVDPIDPIDPIDSADPARQAHPADLTDPASVPPERD